MGQAIIIREMKASELFRVLTLLNECYRDSYEFVKYTKKSFCSYLRAEGATVYVISQGGLRGVATVFKGSWGNKIDLFAIKPGPQATTMGDALVLKIEELLKVDRLYTIVEEGDPSIPDWMARGYKEDGGWCHMVARLSGEVTVPPLRCSATLRTMRADDLAGFISLTNTSFGFQRLSKDCLEQWKKESPEFDLDWVFVAESHGRLLAALVSKSDREYNENFGGRRGYLGPAATLPECQGKGLAGALTAMAMNSLWKRGMSSVNLYTSIKNAPSLSLIKKLGFVNARTFIQLTKQFQK